MWNLSKLPAVPPPCLPPAIDKNDIRGNAAFALRYGSAAAQAQAARASQTPNGDEEKYADKSATYSKGLKQKSYGIVDPDAFKAFRVPWAQATARPSAPWISKTPTSFWAATRSSTNRLRFIPSSNAPAASFALPLFGADAQNFAAPPAFESRQSRLCA